jgi:hypothetical protein
LVLRSVYGSAVLYRDKKVVGVFVAFFVRRFTALIASSEADAQWLLAQPFWPTRSVVGSSGKAGGMVWRMHGRGGSDCSNAVVGGDAIACSGALWLAGADLRDAEGSLPNNNGRICGGAAGQRRCRPRRRSAAH